MKEEVLREIVQNATNLTRQKKLKWQNPDQQLNYFTVKIEDQELQIFNTGVRYVFQILDVNRNTLGSLFEEGYLASGLGSVIFTPVYTSLIGMPNAPYGLKDLFDLAKNSVADADKGLYDLLNKMKKM